MRTLATITVIGLSLAFCQTYERQVRSVTDPGTVTTRQAITPAGVPAVFNGRVYGVAFGKSSSELWVLTATHVYRLDWQANRVLESIEHGSIPGLQGIRSGRVQDRLDNYYNVNAFTDSLDHWGNAGRNILRGPSQAQFDFSFAKLTSIKERYQAEFRWELFNATNTPVFNNPASTFAANGPGTAGVISSTIGGPRTMQAGLRLRW
jgi:hypothetical protein